MQYLDAAPMIRALRENPSAFEMDGDYIRHRPSRHWLSFDWHGNALIAARCHCAELPVRREQSDALRVAVAAWEKNYWRPLLFREIAERRVVAINRAFAGHFRPRGKVQRAIDALLSLVKDRAPLAPLGRSLSKDAKQRAQPGPTVGEAKTEGLHSV